jgi:hypothetical protein
LPCLDIALGNIKKLYNKHYQGIFICRLPPFAVGLSGFTISVNPDKYKIGSMLNPTIASPVTVAIELPNMMCRGGHTLTDQEKTNIEVISVFLSPIIF